MHFTAASVLTALTVAPLASGLGINCRGSGLCSGDKNTMRAIQSRMQPSLFPAGKTFSNGEQIACIGNVSFHFCPVVASTFFDSEIKRDGWLQYGNPRDMLSLTFAIRSVPSCKTPVGPKLRPSSINMRLIWLIMVVM